MARQEEPPPYPGSVTYSHAPISAFFPDTPRRAVISRQQDEPQPYVGSAAYSHGAVLASPAAPFLGLIIQVAYGNVGGMPVLEIGEFALAVDTNDVYMGTSLGNKFAFHLT